MSDEYQDMLDENRRAIDAINHAWCRFYNKAEGPFGYSQQIPVAMMHLTYFMLDIAGKVQDESSEKVSE